MTKHMWHVSGMLLIVLVFCQIVCQSHGRTAPVSTYQHLNGINVRADVSAHKTDSSNSAYEPEIENDEQSQSSSSSEQSGIWKDFRLIYRIYQQCSNENLSVCLKVKLLTGLEKVLRSSKTLRIFDGVQFTRSEDSEPSNAATDKLPSDQDIEATLPRSLEAKETVLNNLIFKKLIGFLRDHTLQVKFPDVRSWNDVNDNSVEGRKKKEKKGHGAFIMIPLLLGGTFVPIAYGALAMLAGKALIVSKLALVLASIIGIKKLLSGHSQKDSHEVVVSSSGGSGGWGRDMDLAYHGWKPAKDAQKIA